MDVIVGFVWYGGVRIPAPRENIKSFAARRMVDLMVNLSLTLCKGEAEFYVIFLILEM